jgi:hypothetical protein
VGPKTVRTSILYHVLYRSEKHLGVSMRLVDDWVAAETTCVIAFCEYGLRFAVIVASTVLSMQTTCNAFRMQSICQIN